jgi:hypothetical protein
MRPSALARCVSHLGSLRAVEVQPRSSRRVAELDAYQPPSGLAPPPVPPSTPDSGGFEDDPFNEPVDGSAFTHDGTSDEADGNPQASAATTMLNSASRAKLQSLDIGLTESDPATLGTYNEQTGTAQRNPDFGSLAPDRLRPIVPYRVVEMLNDQHPNPQIRANLRRRARMWDDWYKRARALGLKADVTISRDLDTESGGRPPTIREYRAGLSAFLGRYGSVVQNLTAWNEPNFRRAQLRVSPRLAAWYWIHARQLCHPCGAPKRCGHVAAGEYAGIIASKERKSASHTERFALLGDRTPPLLDRYHRLYSRADYETASGERARIWLSAIGSPYTYGCASLSPAKQRTVCGGESENRNRVLFVGMRRQRDTLAFVLGQIATKYRGITRLDPSTPENERARPYCARDDWGVVGADHDGTID